MEEKMPDITNLATNTTFNAKINKVENEVFNVNNLTKTAAFKAEINVVKNKIQNCSYCYWKEST